MIKIKSLFLLSAFFLVGCDNDANNSDLTTNNKNDANKDDGFTKISQIQGSGNSSPLTGELHTIEAVITGLTNNGFFVQEEMEDSDNDASTSEGIFVYYPNINTLNLSVGETIQVTGIVDEFNDLTQLKDSILSFNIKSNKNANIEALLLEDDYASENLESYEGMLVSINNQYVIDVYSLGRYGELSIAPKQLSNPQETFLPLSHEFIEAKQNNSAYQLLLEDNNTAQNPDGLSYFPAFSYDATIKVNDKVDSATGPLNYSFGQYRINLQSEDNVRFTINPRQEIDNTIFKTADLKVASFNVLNYFNGNPTYANVGVTETLFEETFDLGLIQNWEQLKGGIEYKIVEEAIEPKNSVLEVSVKTGNQADTDLITKYQVQANKKYQFSLKVKHPTPGVRLTAFYGMNNKNIFKNVYTDPNNPEWQTYTLEITPETDGELTLGIRFYDIEKDFKPGEKVFLDDLIFIMLPDEVPNDSNYVGQSFDQNGRGVQSQAFFEIQQARIVNALIELDADVIGLIEVENDGFDKYSAIQSIVDKMNEKTQSPDLYKVVKPSAEIIQIGTDEITNGIIYRSDKISLNGQLKIIDMPYQEWDEGKKFATMRPTVMANFVHNQSSEAFLVAVNHFKSKGSDCFEDANMPSMQDTVQGSCNALRVSAAVMLGEELKKSDYPTKQILLGDFNSYSKEDPILVLTQIPQELNYQITPALNTIVPVSLPSEGYGFNLPKENEPNYSYTFKGERGSLDHILVSNDLKASVSAIKIWNINSIEPSGLLPTSAFFENFKSDYHKAFYFNKDNVYLSSDHDPVVIGVNFQK